MEKSNWIPTSNLLGLIKPLIQINENPYYKKWGKGRPTKEMIKQRELSSEWEVNNSHLLKLVKCIKDTKPSHKHEEKQRFSHGNNKH